MTAQPQGRSAGTMPDFAALYTENVRFVWVNLRRLGVSEDAIEDAVQDVFLVIHRRLAEFEGRSSLRTWIFGILLRVASRHRRRASTQHELLEASGPLLDALSQSEGPFELALRRESAELLHKILDRLEEDKRNMLILVELEQISVVEAAQALNLNLNTAYARLRAARRALEDHLEAHLSKLEQSE